MRPTDSLVPRNAAYQRWAHTKASTSAENSTYSIYRGEDSSESNQSLGCRIDVGVLWRLLGPISIL